MRIVGWCLFLLIPAAGFAQSIPNGTITQGEIWTPAQWNVAWQSKADTTNGVLVSPNLGTPSAANLTNATGLPAGALVSVSLSATLGATQNNLAVSGFTINTTRLLLTAASGGSTVTGIAGGFDGMKVTVINPSTTDSIYFSHLSGSSSAANQFSNVNASLVVLPPLGAARMEYVINQWKFL